MQERADSSLPEGARRVVQSGVDGIDRTTYQLTRDGDSGRRRSRRSAPCASGRRSPRSSRWEPSRSAAPADQTGIATWYATLYQPGTCAHLHIPFGTMVRVTDTDTGAAATCRVADRGPEAWTGNIIDLSPDVFEQLQPLSTGEIHVRLDY